LVFVAAQRKLKVRMKFYVVKSFVTSNETNHSKSLRIFRTCISLHLIKLSKCDWANRSGHLLRSR